MAKRKILHYPDNRLRIVATPVINFNTELSTLIKDMFETMYAERGIGLAATQINEHIRVIVVDVSENADEKLHIVNPEIVEKKGRIESKEGCLSVPQAVDFVERAEEIEVRGQDCNGRNISFSANGLLAICIQHEVDHLDGKLFVDYLSGLKRSRLKKKAAKLGLKESVAP